MTAVRRNVLEADVRADFIRGVNLLKHEETGLTTDQFGIPGPPTPVRTYDLFVIWHVLAMNTPVPPGGDPNRRNGAHRGPVFLPWHRLMLAWLELYLQRALDDREFGLPYWDWAADGTPPFPGGVATPAGSPLWQDTPDALGGAGIPVPGGGFAYDPADPGSFRVRIVTDGDGALRQTADRGLVRRFGRPEPFGSPTLPTTTHVLHSLDAFLEPDMGVYDFPDYDAASRGFRNRLEGFRGPGLHNQVHRWVGGDMGPASSPNDPVFFLHHCNVDRVWESWMRLHGREYLPDMTAPADLQGHRIDDPLISPFNSAGNPVTPGQVLEISQLYTYDALVG